jgi:endoribonuclease LACTB2
VTGSRVGTRKAHAMSEPEVTIVNVGYHSTNYWVVSAGRSRLLVDLGWPGTMAHLRANLQRSGVPFEEIRYAVATHYHVDHAGLAEELKRAGVTLLVLETQLDALGRLGEQTKPGDGCVPIATGDNLVISFADSRAVLAGMGIGGQIVATPGHSDDSVSLLLDDGSAFTGDLGPVLSDSETDPVAASWRRLAELGMSRVYPGHGPLR